MTKLMALTLGDRYGVGPELVARYVDALPADFGARIVVVGDRAAFEQGRQSAGVAGAYAEVGDLEAMRAGDARWALLHRPFEAEVRPLGRVSKDAGAEVLATLEFVVEAVRSGAIDGIVYAPLNKQAMRLAGHAAGDELDFFGTRLGAGETGEINILNDLWTSRVTSHVPLRAVGDLITRASVMRGIELMATALRKSGKASPRIAVAALNPHAGEGGAFGMEEIEIIAPAVAEAQQRQMRVEGPFPSDTIFPRAIRGEFDGVVTMFHDQGQIALKMVGLGQGITLLTGMQVPIATPGHGTAYDIAGRGTAKVDGLAAAVGLVARMMNADSKNGEVGAD
jgi:4-hydroxythreonine-4-phosphate dehydrogenase